MGRDFLSNWPPWRHVPPTSVWSEKFCIIILHYRMHRDWNGAWFIWRNDRLGVVFHRCRLDLTNFSSFASQRPSFFAYSVTGIGACFLSKWPSWRRVLPTSVRSEKLCIISKGKDRQFSYPAPSQLGRDFFDEMTVLRRVPPTSVGSEKFCGVIFWHKDRLGVAFHRC
jgi:hypothetical protein